MGTDLGIDYPLKMYTDASAAMGMSRRLGVGKVRHLDTQLLWIQTKVKSGEIQLEKVLGAHNPADCLTKNLPGPALREHIQRMGLTFEQGRASAAPELTNAQIPSPTVEPDGTIA